MNNHKICVITGSSAGIGKYAAIELAKSGFEIVMLVRDSQKSRDAFEEIRKKSGSDLVSLLFVDLSSLDSVRNAAENAKKHYPRIDILLNNAGIFKRKEERSADGFEMTLAVNYYALFCLTNLLIPWVKKAKNGRIINLVSELYKNGNVDLENAFSLKRFSGNKAYANSKLLVMYFTGTLAKKLAKTGITVNALHPGVVGTDIFREYPAWFRYLLNLLIARPDKGAESSVYLASSGEVKDVTGTYFNRTRMKKTAPVANDEELGEKIWERTEALLRDFLTS